MDIVWIQPYYHIILDLIPRDAKKILDVGAGYGIFGYILKKTRNAEIHAVEPFYDDLPHDVVFKYTWQECHPHLERYDVLVATEFIEHLQKDEALLFLEQAKEKSNLVIIATPIKFESQPEYDGNQLQKHQCLISEDEFIRCGYQIRKLERNIISVWSR